MYEAAGKFKVLKFIVIRMVYSILMGFFRFACLARTPLFSYEPPEAEGSFSKIKI